MFVFTNGEDPWVSDKTVVVGVAKHDPRDTEEPDAMETRDGARSATPREDLWRIYVQGKTGEKV